MARFASPQTGCNPIHSTKPKFYTNEKVPLIKPCPFCSSFFLRRKNRRKPPRPRHGSFLRSWNWAHSIDPFRIQTNHGHDRILPSGQRCFGGRWSCCRRCEKPSFSERHSKFWCGISGGSPKRTSTKGGRKNCLRWHCSAKRKLPGFERSHERAAENCWNRPYPLPAILLDVQKQYGRHVA